MADALEFVGADDGAAGVFAASGMTRPSAGSLKNA